MAASLVSSVLFFFSISVHVYRKDSFAASFGRVSGLRTAEVSLLCDESEQLQDAGLSMAIEVVEVYQ